MELDCCSPGDSVVHQFLVFLEPLAPKGQALLDARDALLLLNLWVPGLAVVRYLCVCVFG